jgi:hypothetical protein
MKKRKPCVGDVIEESSSSSTEESSDDERIIMATPEDSKSLHYLLKEWY